MPAHLRDHLAAICAQLNLRFDDVVCELAQEIDSRPDNRAIGGVGRKRARLGRRRARQRLRPSAQLSHSAMLLKRAFAAWERSEIESAAETAAALDLGGCPGLEGRRRSLLVRQFVREDFDALHFRAFLPNRSAFEVICFASLPWRWASRPRSLANVSSMPNILGPIRIANQAVVSGSSLIIDLALDRKFATSCSLPGLASS